MRPWELGRGKDGSRLARPPRVADKQAGGEAAPWRVTVRTSKRVRMELSPDMRKHREEICLTASAMACLQEATRRITKVTSSM